MTDLGDILIVCNDRTAAAHALAARLRDAGASVVWVDRPSEPLSASALPGRERIVRLDLGDRADRLKWERLVGRADIVVGGIATSPTMDVATLRAAHPLLITCALAATDGVEAALPVFANLLQALYARERTGEGRHIATALAAASQHDAPPAQDPPRPSNVIAFRALEQRPHPALPPRLRTML